MWEFSLYDIEMYRHFFGILDPLAERFRKSNLDSYS